MLRAAAGLARSLSIYRAPTHLRSLTAFCADIAPGARLVFDIGAHAGDRVTAFRRLGANVVAVEPQRVMAAWLRARFALDPGATVVRAACGPAPGTARLSVNRANPTVSTLSKAFVEAARDAPGWEGQRWDAAAETPVVTLDALIEAHGAPDFIKIDVEGYEAEVLAGLTRPLARPVPRLGFEVVTAARDAGLAALSRAEALGYARFRLTLGESHAWHGPEQNAAAMAETLRALPDAANSGDVICTR